MTMFFFTPLISILFFHSAPVFCVVFFFPLFSSLIFISHFRIFPHFCVFFFSSLFRLKFPFFFLSPFFLFCHRIFLCLIPFSPSGCVGSSRTLFLSLNDIEVPYLNSRSFTLLQACHGWKLTKSVVINPFASQKKSQ